MRVWSLQSWLEYSHILFDGKCPDRSHTLDYLSFLGRNLCKMLLSVLWAAACVMVLIRPAAGYVGCQPGKYLQARRLVPVCARGFAPPPPPPTPEELLEAEKERKKRSMEKQKYQELKQLAKKQSSLKKLLGGGGETTPPAQKKQGW